jgi:hypothetical protein
MLLMSVLFSVLGMPLVQMAVVPLSARDQGLECGPRRLVEQLFLLGGGDLTGGQDVDPAGECAE